MTSKNDTPNKIKQSCLCCIYCGKSYKTRNNMDKHVVLCETIYRSKNNKSLSLQDDEIEDIQLPTQKQMYNIILELTVKYNKLEEKMEQMTKWIEKKKKKINVIEWLNTNITPTCTFDELINKIIVTNDNIDSLLSSGFIAAFTEVISTNIFEKKETHQFPVFCLDQKTNYIYIYTRQSNQENQLNNSNFWVEIEKETLVHFVNKIHMKITKCLTEWKKRLEEQNNFNDSNTDLYNKTLIKLMDLNFKNETVLNKMKGIIYTGMKTDIKNLIEYEFEF